MIEIGEITKEQIDRVNAILFGMQNAPNEVFAKAINEGLKSARSETLKQVGSVYAISRSDLISSSKIGVKKASKGNLIGEISYAGHKIPLYKFNSKTNSKAVSAAVLKGNSPVSFMYAFMTRMKSSHVGIFERVTDKRLPIEEIYGPAAAQAAANAVVMEETEKAVHKTVDERIELEITRILNAQGGLV